MKKRLSVILVFSLLGSMIAGNVVAAESDHMDERETCTMTIEYDKHTPSDPAEATGVCEGAVFGFYAPSDDDNDETFGLTGAVEETVHTNGQQFELEDTEELENPILTVNIVRPQTEEGTDSKEESDSEAVEVDKEDATEQSDDDAGSEEGEGENSADVTDNDTEEVVEEDTDVDAENEEEEEQPFLLQVGDKDEIVSTLKENLQFLGFGQFETVNTSYDEQTEAAVTYLQTYYDLEQTGTVDEELLLFIDELLATPFQSGNRNQKTIEMKQALYTLGYWDSKSGTTLYGSQTAAAIEKFQADQELVVSGIADEITLQRLEELSTAPLSKGMYRQDASSLKTDLERLGFGSFAKTDYYGPQTEKVVKAFQSHYGLKQTGKADQATLNKIEALTNSPYQSRKRYDGTVSLKEKLYTLGYWDSKSGTTLYGSKTEQAVKLFQKDRNLPQSGIADEITRETLNVLVQQPLQNGMYHKDAISLKEGLERLGFGSFAKTDYFGPQTEKTLKSFQSYYGLTTSGQADEDTLTKLKNQLNSPLQKGKRHKDTITLKEDLYKLDYWSSQSGTTLYGSKTEKAIKQFQKDYGLRQSGIADEVTIAKLSSLAKQPLKKGMYRKDAIEVKEKLEQLGFGSFAKTDYYGPKTEKVVKQFQAHYGLTESGQADQVTVDKLNELLNSPFQKDKRHKETVKLKENLYVLGYWDSKSGTTLYGSKTAKAVTEFQKDNDLPVSGIADKATREKLQTIAEQPLQNGMYREDAIELKANLETLGFGTYVKNDYVGPKTERYMKQFQRYYAIPETGIADKATMNKIEAILDTDMQNGRQSEAVITLKQNLQKLGYWSSDDAPTDYYGPKTENAIIAFQINQGLAVNGIADQPTLKVIEALLDVKLIDLEKDVFQLVNQEREKVDLLPLTLDKHLSYVARQKSNDMVENDYFDHVSPTYGSLPSLLEHFNVSYSVAGENIARGYQTSAAVVEAWMDSEGHRENILNADYTHIGVGYKDNYWTQTFKAN
ncbi:peptidoglycan-binding protein [Gracilibacillus sp. S3-1-1]|uniref:Peptidoglycan-binding protein n=1 Tax=Gracilibacillus pellucidus TaxID=3095368 RepID=A0ACC6M809_9BACI|nr:peptidoglycan-binding protein [Gracilibacillus sp. S3-1-1]MDX8047100.1 peptidoglycan-binding protein [Gracilibacillus sp. S3-1-1]